MLVENSTTTSSSNCAIYYGNNPLLPSLINSSEQANLSHWSPLVLYGESGAGKSFVALSIANQWNATTSEGENPPLVTTAADLARLFQPSHLANEMVATSKLYRSTSLLVVDDVHQLVVRDNACSWLVGVLDYRNQFGLPTIVTTSSMAALSRLSKMLFSRLSGGLPVSLALPDQNTRHTIIQDTVNSLPSANVSPKQIKSLIERSEGLSIIATRNLVQSVLSDQLPNVEEPISRDTDDIPGRCLLAAAKRFGVRVADIKGSSRRKNTVLARSVAMFLIREFSSLSLVDTGLLFQNRDHSTVRHACQKISKLLLSDAHTQDAVRSMCASLNLRYDSRWSVSIDEKCA